MRTTSTPAVEWPPGGAGSTQSSASQRRAATDFGALLDQPQARTATAEGPKKRSEEKALVGREHSRRDEAKLPGPVGPREPKPAESETAPAPVAAPDAP